MHFSIPETETRAGDGGAAYVVSGAAAGPGGFAALGGAARPRPGFEGGERGGGGGRGGEDRGAASRPSPLPVVLRAR